MVKVLKLVGKGLWFIAMLCLYLLTCNAIAPIDAQDKRVTNNLSSPPEIPMALPSSPSGHAINQTFPKAVLLPNNSSGDASGISNNTHFLKYNNLGNNYNKAGSTSYNLPGYSDPVSAYMQPFPSTTTSPYYYPSYNQQPYSFGANPIPPLPPPSYSSYPLSSPPFSPSLASTAPIYPSGLPPSSGVSGQPYFLPSPPPPMFPAPRYPPEIAKDSSLDLPAETEDPKMVSPWFPSIPASDCEGIFEFTLEGTANLQTKDVKSGNHKITIKMTADSADLINGQLWVDKKSKNDKGSKFDIDRTFNNCRVVTASSLPSSAGQQQESSSSLLNSLLNDLPGEGYSAEEELSDEEVNNGNSGNSQQQEVVEDGDSIERKGKNKIAALE
jgi:hypothetical protein